MNTAIDRITVTETAKGTRNMKNRTALALGVIVGMVVMLAVWVNYLLNRAGVWGGQ